MSKFYRDNGSFYDPEYNDGRTKQAFKDECDINRIMTRAMAHGLPEAGEQVYADVSSISPDTYLEMKNQISEVVGALEHLSSVDRRFYGTPEAFLNAKYAEHMEKLKAEAEASVEPVLETPPAESAESVEPSQEGSGA